LSYGRTGMRNESLLGPAVKPGSRPHL